MATITKFIGWDKDNPVKTLPMWTGGFIHDKISGGIKPDIRYIPNEKTINDVADDHVEDGTVYYKQHKNWYTIAEAKAKMPEVSEEQWSQWLDAKVNNIQYWQCALCAQKYPVKDKASIEGHILMVHGGKEKYNAKIQESLDAEVNDIPMICEICGFEPPFFDKKERPMSEALRKQSMRMHLKSHKDK